MSTQLSATPNGQGSNDAPRGLTAAEVTARRAAGQGNTLRLATSRTYADIIRSNVLNLINIVLFSIGAVMVAIGRVGDAVTSVGLILFNILIGIVQEIRAKQQLDKIALLTRPRVSVTRDGSEQTIQPEDLVVGDVVLVRPGDQFVVDGALGGGKIEADESLLTGESDPVHKQVGDEILSGSFCISGAGWYETTRVGADSFANKLTANARQFTISFTPLQREVNLLLRLLILLALIIGFLVLLGALLSGVPFVRQVQMAAVIAGLVPNGLFFMVILSYALGAVRIVRQGALVQQTNAVESLANVTVLCTDKTGTLTANRIQFHDAHPVGVEANALKRMLGIFARSAAGANKTAEALIAGLPGEKRAVVDEVPFSSALKWSALAFDLPDMKGVYALGAPENLRDHIELDAAARERIAALTDQGLRVLVFGQNAAVTTLHDDAGEPSLPRLTPLGIISLSDELRPQLKETLEGFLKGGVALKIISGDNPNTVAALAKQAGLTGDFKTVSGGALDAMTGAEFAQIVHETTIFGRITPQQKERIVDALRAQNHYVAMIGDGVNDVLSLKKANLGIAMESGSSATRSVADMILLGDSFGALPAAFSEGQRIVAGMKDIFSLFLVRVGYAALLIIGIAVIGVGFPFIPKQNALLVLFGVGVPTLGLALWAKPSQLPTGGLLRQISHFVLPAMLSIFFVGTLVYVTTFTVTTLRTIEVPVTPEAIAQFEEFTGIFEEMDARTFALEAATLTAQTALTVFTTFAGLALILFVEPPTRWFEGGDVYSGDLRPTLLAGALLIGFCAIVLIEPARAFFEMVALPFIVYAALAGVTLVWMLLLRGAWRGRWLERFLKLEG
ncbi:MAG: HAD-IC family P-type ATPase [Anaerolineae bacterium]|nr:HAD-IC family P-type ATPase [Anaerolineae bacterium]NUQ04137.1 HAD-IC family P-type ATPase [Anaerolineae bacterium]